MTTAAPKVQIFCITYKHESFIGQALESFVRQKTTFPFEVVIADDASPDGTADIIRDYQRRYPEIIKPIFRTENMGVDRNSRETANILTAEYVALCEGDDYWTCDDKLQKQVEALEARPDCAVCFHPVLLKWEDGSREDSIFPEPAYRFNKAELTLEDLLVHNFIQTNSVMYRWRFRDGSYSRVFPKDILPGDWFLHLLHAEKGKILFLDECMSVYRKHPGGLWEGCGVTDEWFSRCGVKHLRFFRSVKAHFGPVKTLNFLQISEFAFRIAEYAKRRNRNDVLRQLRAESRLYYYGAKSYPLIVLTRRIIKMKIWELLKNYLCPPVLWRAARNFKMHWREMVKDFSPPVLWRTAQKAKTALEAKLLSDPNLYSTMEGGLLRIRITHKCNARCRYCGIRFYSKELQKMSMKREVLYEYCLPLYEQIKILLLTGGDPLASEESFPFCSFISGNYPQITLLLETNGLGFTEKWQRMAAENLMKVHISLNASNEEVYCQGCWAGEQGRNAWQGISKNIRDYMSLLREKGLDMFAPDVSMVINQDTAADVRAFVKYALAEGLHHCGFYFDYTESNMSNDYFGQPETSRRALNELLKIERVLAGKFQVFFRLWIPLKELKMMQPEVEAIPLAELNNEYADILEMAKGRSMEAEYEARRAIRKSRGKKEISFEEDWLPALRQTRIGGKITCASPFHLLDIYPDGRFECCSWITPRFTVECGAVDWEREYNSLAMKRLRRDMLNNRYTLCMVCCPLNPNHK